MTEKEIRTAEQEITGYLSATKQERSAAIDAGVLTPIEDAAYTAAFKKCYNELNALFVQGCNPQPEDVYTEDDETYVIPITGMRRYDAGGAPYVEIGCNGKRSKGYTQEEAAENWNAKIYI